MLFSYGSGQQQINATKNAGELMTISIAMAMQRYNAGRITLWSTSGTSLEATGCRHRSSACAVLPQQPPWSTTLVENTKH
jgi:hypothetical protein